MPFSFKEKWTQIKQYIREKKDEIVLGGADDPMVWYRDLLSHPYGEVSFAVVQGNQILEDHSQVESVGDVFFVGVYDGHGGATASNYIYENLYPTFAQNPSPVSEEVLRSAIYATEEGFLSLVDRTYESEPLIAAAGSCCLVGVIQRETLYVANVGDSRAVLGSLGNRNKIVANQLTNDHNAREERVRDELMRSHPDDDDIVYRRFNDVWRVKGIIQVSRAIGDAHLKMTKYTFGEEFPRFHLKEPVRLPILTAEPEIFTRTLEDTDSFLIFASDGLWEHITNEQAVDLVHKKPRRGIARRLLKKAQSRAAKKSGTTYAELKKIERQKRRSILDDITVVVVYIDFKTPHAENISVPNLSVRGFSDKDELRKQGDSAKHQIDKGKSSIQEGSSKHQIDKGKSSIQEGSSKHQIDKGETSKQEGSSKYQIDKGQSSKQEGSSKHQIDKGETSKQEGSSKQKLPKFLRKLL